MTKNTKTTRFELRFSPKEKEAMEQIARARGVSLSGFLREQALAAAKHGGDLIAA